jgi:Tfp pilus assembly protein PilV
MKIHRHHTQSGFSAVELLITLFIAAAFIATCYQLYAIIIKTGGETRSRAKASNIAYDAIRRYANQATNPCTTVTPTPTPSIPSGSGLPAASITVTITCPYGIGTTTGKIRVSVKYGTPQEEVVHALFVTN